MQQDAEKPEDEGASTGDGQPAASSEALERDLEAALQEAHDKHLRTLAEMENLRRRHTRELDEGGKYAMAGFARDLLDVADNMRRALAAVPEEARQGHELVETLLSGVELTERSLLAAFDKLGVQRIVPERGEKFDHNRHQAMFEVPTADLPPGHVADVMQTGWVIADRLLRPAMVGVTKAAPKPAAAEAANDGEAGRGRAVDTNA
jgi:molecular chaperone GrpE